MPTLFFYNLYGLAGNSGKLGKSCVILRMFFLFEMASSANLDNVLKQLTAIFRRLNSGEDALSELQVLKEHCGRVLAEERKRVSNSANREKVRSCEFSKLQFPISQKYR